MAMVLERKFIPSSFISFQRLEKGRIVSGKGCKSERFECIVALGTERPQCNFSWFAKRNRRWHLISFLYGMARENRKSRRYVSEIEIFKNFYYKLKVKQG
jgi:hypothetical protein